MSNARTRYDTIAEFMQREHDATATLLYKQPSVQINGTPFLFYMEPGMAFRLRGRMRDQALALKDARLWAPTGEPPQTSPWVLVPVVHFLRWDRLAVEALRFAQEVELARPKARPSEGAPKPPPAADRWFNNIQALMEKAKALRLAPQAPVKREPKTFADPEDPVPSSES